MTAKKDSEKEKRLSEKDIKFQKGRLYCSLYGGI